MYKIPILEAGKAEDFGIPGSNFSGVNFFDLHFIFYQNRYKLYREKLE